MEVSVLFVMLLFLWDNPRANAESRETTRRWLAKSDGSFDKKQAVVLLKNEHVILWKTTRCF